MYIKSISILNYKNIAQADLHLSPKINCFIGSNGEGKTNLLDAIYFLSFTKSYTNSIDSMNIRHGEDFLMLQGLYDINGTEEEIYCGMKLKQKKTFKRNKKSYQRMSDHIGLAPLIIVSPNDIQLIIGGSEERRKFMDSVISQYDKGYLNLLNSYNKALLQRNALLKQEDEPDINLMITLEEIMASYGEEIYSRRNAFIEEFIPVFQKFYSIISGNSEKVGIKYLSHCQRGPLLDIIQRDRAKERIVGYSLHGVHKDELEMTLGGYGIKKEASQGQSKTFLISLKFAQFEFLKNTGSKTTPLLLLDDIFDKLDSNRVEEIVRIVVDDSFGQIFITDTNKDNLSGILKEVNGEYKIFNVSNGEINPL